MIKPYLTEKSALAMDKGLYVFLIDERSNKITIAKELKSLYDVTATSVRIVNLPAKKVTFRRIPGFQPARHKAYIQLKQGQKIPGFESLVEKDKKAKTEATKDSKKENK